MRSSQEMGVGRSRDGVFRACNDQRANRNALDRFALVHITKGGTCGDVALRRRVQEHLPRGFHRFREFLDEIPQ